VVLDIGGLDRIVGFDPGTDVLDLHSLLSGTSVNLNAGAAAVGRYVTAVDQRPDAVIRFDPAGRGDGGGTVAILSGLGNAVAGLDTLLARGAIRLDEPAAPAPHPAPADPAGVISTPEVYFGSSMKPWRER
jgi:hypothetical protein